MRPRAADAPGDAGVPPARPDLRPGSTRRDPYVLLAIALVLLVLRVILGIREPQSLRGSAVPAAGAPDQVHWRPFAAAVDEARRTQRPLLYDFSAEWCGPCQAMQRDIFADPQAAAEIERRFVPVHVVDRAREEGHNPAWVDSLQRAFGVQAFPTLVVQGIGDDGHPSVAGRQGSVRIEGYMGREFTMGRIEAAASHVRLQTVLPPPPAAAPTPTSGP